MGLRLRPLEALDIKMDKDINYRKNLIWNMAASVVNAAEAVIVIMVASRVNIREESGMLTLAFSVANLSMMVGKFGIKNYQISHDGFDIEFGRFLRLRLITVLIMIAGVGSFLTFNLLGNRYSVGKSVIILCVCVWYVIEAFEDVFVAHLQADGRLHVGNKLFIFRWTLILSTVVAADIISRNLILALVLADIAAVVAEAAGLAVIISRFRIRTTLRGMEVKSLLTGNLPLCVSDLSYYYLTNASKYIIDGRMDDVSQAVYGYITMPIFVVSLLNSIIYQPRLMGYVSDIREHNVSGLVKKILRQIAVIVIILATCLVGAYFLGIPVLSWLYSMNLSDYKAYLLMLIGGGTALALGGYFVTVLVLLGKRKAIMVIFLITAVFSTIITDVLVDRLALAGAVYGFIVSMVLMAGVFLALLIITLNRLKREKLQHV